jgi:hypothetical protein
MPLHWKQLSVHDWNFLIEKIENKLQGWKGKLLSLGGRVVLLKVVLSSIPLYWMSLYRLPVKLKKRIDQLCRSFLWYGGSSVKKNSLVSWKILCTSKQQGGMKILDLDIMNKTLLAKWIFRFKDNKVIRYWKKIITFKYARVRNRAHFSLFWKDVSKDLDLVEFCINKVVGNGLLPYFGLIDGEDQLP